MPEETPGDLSAAFWVDLASLRAQVAAALDRSIDRCARCKVCDAQVDAAMAALGAEFDRMHSALEHAQSAAAGSHEGIRLWMLDCGELVQKHREHAVEASALLTGMRERAEAAEAKLAGIEAHAPAITDALRYALSYVEHVPNPSSQAAAERYKNALAVISGEEEARS